MDEKKLSRYITGDLSPKDRNEVVKWINASEKNLNEYKAKRMLHDILLWNNAPAPSAEEAQKIRKDSLGKRMLRRFSFVAIAASIAFLSIFMYHAGQKSEISNSPVFPRSITAPTGHQIKMLLEDGSTVWLNSGSTLRIAEARQGRERAVELLGEGYFKVVPDAKRPFLVKAGKLEVQVLGTEFNVISYPDQGFWETALLSGSIAVMENREEIMRIGPGNKVSLVDNRLLTAPLDEEKYLWKDGILSFTGRTLKEIFSELSSYFNVEIRYPESTNLNKTYSGKFWISEGLYHILDVLTYDNRFTYAKIDKDDEQYIQIRFN